MKNKLYRIIYFFCVSILVFVYSFNAYSLISWADVPSGQIVVGNSGSWSGFPFTFTTTGKYYTVQDPTGIPTSTYLAPIYFYTSDGEKFFQVNGLKLFTGVLNKIVGIIYEPNELNTLFTGFLNATDSTDNTNNKYVANGLYDSNDNFLGICLNDISGCYYGGNPPTGTNVKDDGNYSNNVKNYIDYEIDQGNFDLPVYFTFYGISDTYLMSNLNTTLDSSQYSAYQQFRYDYDFISNASFESSKFTFFAYGYNNNSTRNKIAGYNDVSYAVCTDGINEWKLFCTNHVNSNICLATDLIYEFYLNDSRIRCNTYNSNGSVLTSGVLYDPYNMTQSNTSTVWFDIGKYGSGITMPFNFEKITIYKDTTVVNNFQNEIYTPSVYYTDSFNNYDSNTDNSIDMPITQINQSISSNTSIYDSSAENFYNYYDNGTYDQSSATTNITNITNNYYGSGGDNPDNPDDPNDPDDPSDVLTQILQALLRFFTAIGQILGTVLAGLLTVFDEILEAIATVTEDLSGMSDFFSSLFAWIPDPVPQVLGLGFTICILCGLIKFIRG